MFGRSKPTVFKPVPYLSQRQSRRVPSWLLFTGLGAAVGSAGLWYAQENYLPPRLSLSETLEVRRNLEAAVTEREKLRVDLAATSSKLKVAQEHDKKAQTDLALALQATDRLQKNLTQLVSALPSDPRGGVVGIRMASFTHAAGQLSHQIILTRAAQLTDTFKGSVQLVVTGQRSAGRDEVLTLSPIVLAMDTVQQVAGSQALPIGFVPREVSVRVLRNTDLVSSRVFRIN
jgi:hypothetical protein